METDQKKNEIKKGGIYWATIKSEIAHPHVVVEIKGERVSVCAITTNMNKLNMPGVVLLKTGEAGLEKQSIVEGTKSFWIDASRLGEFLGLLSKDRLEQIKAGMRLAENLNPRR
jgi:mRNA interferase MazF